MKKILSFDDTLKHITGGILQDATRNKDIRNIREIQDGEII